MTDSASRRTEAGGCELCPRRCGARRDEGALGACGCPSEPLVAHVQLHHWEEPSISGRRGSGTIFFSGCALACAYCQNAAISRRAMGEADAPVRLAGRMLALQEAGAHNVNLVTPTHFADRIREAVVIARAQALRIPIVWNTSGYETTEAIDANAGLVDVYLTDFKYASSDLAGALSGAPDYPEVAARALARMIETVGEAAHAMEGDCSLMVRGVIVRHLVLPGHADESKRVLELVRRIGGDAVRLSIMSQYTPLIATRAQAGEATACAALERFPELARRVSDEEYEEVLSFADSLGIEDYDWQQGGAAEESFIPAFSSDAR